MTRHPPIRLASLRCVFVAACASVLADRPAAQTSDTSQSPQEAWDYQDPPRRSPDHELELTLADSSFWLEYRTAFDRNDGQFFGRFFANTDDDLAFNAKFQRWGPMGESLHLGVGLGAYAAFVDEPNDTALSVAITGAARYELPTRMPTRIVAQLALAPEITSFVDGEGVFDFDLRWEGDINDFATVFGGYRYFEVELEDGRGRDEELDDSIHIGVRLGF